MIFFPRFWRQAGILAGALALTAPWLSQAETLSPARLLAGKIIVLDPGHAVKNASGQIVNPGAQARPFRATKRRIKRNGKIETQVVPPGALERDVALAVAAKMVPVLEGMGATVYLTRTPRNPWRYHDIRQADNRARAIMANLLKAHAYVRLHCDWNRSKQFKGHTAFYYRWNSRPLAKQVNAAMVQALPNARDNGVHRRSFVSVTARMPTILVEMGVLSYPPEAASLAQSEYQDRLAQAIADGIAGYFRDLSLS